MFRQKSRETLTLADVGNVPDTALGAARAEWAELMGGPIVERNRWFIVAIVLLCLLFVSIWTSWRMAPLIRVVPYIIKVDDLTGEVKASTAAQEYKPGEKERKYFLARWIRNVHTIDPVLTESKLREAFLFVRGKAISEYKDFMDKTKPLARSRENQTLSRQVTVKNITFINENVANIRFEAEERQAGAQPVTTRYAAIVHFEIIPPTTEKEIVENPLGIFITDFTISEDIQ